MSDDEKDAGYRRGYEAGRDGTGGASTAATFILGETKQESAGRRQGESDWAKYGGRGDRDVPKSSSDLAAEPRKTERAAGTRTSSKGDSHSASSARWSSGPVASPAKYGIGGFLLLYLMSQFVAHGILRYGMTFNPVQGFDPQSIGEFIFSLLMLPVTLIAFIFALPTILPLLFLGFDVLLWYL